MSLGPSIHNAFDDEAREDIEIMEHNERLIKKLKDDIKGSETIIIITDQEKLAAKTTEGFIHQVLSRLVFTSNELGLENKRVFNVYYGVGELRNAQEIKLFWKQSGEVTK